MKLHNKKTGEIVDSDDYMLSIGRYGIALRTIDDSKKDYTYESLAEFVEDWEDYKPKEPLIKDKKIRKAVRAWAEANRDVNEVIYEYDTNTPYCELVDKQSEARIRFNFLFIKELNTYGLYTITELCGEE